MLSVSFTEDERSRYQAISDEAQFGMLTVGERSELDELLAANDVMITMRSKVMASFGNDRP